MEGKRAQELALISRHGLQIVVIWTELNSCLDRSLDSINPLQMSTKSSSKKFTTSRKEQDDRYNGGVSAEESYKHNSNFSSRKSSQNFNNDGAFKVNERNLKSKANLIACKS